MAQKFLSDIHPTAGLKDSSGDLGASGQVLSSTGSGTNWVQAGSGATVIHDDQFTATANQTAFTLSNTVDAENKTQVYIDGAYQAKAGYTVSGTTLTFDTGLDVGSKVEVITFATAIASNATAVIKLDEFVPGDAISGTSGQNFTLSQTVSDEKVTQVYINGVYQHKDTYSISGTTLQFSSAPPSGSDIEVITFDTVVAADGTLSATTFLGDLNGTINTATTATTQSAGNNSTKISTTAYTDAKVADAINNGTTAIAPSQNAVFDALALKANLAGPTFTGVPAAPTASAGTNTTQLATTAFVTTGISNIVDSSPAALNTLNELAAALGDDANFSTTVTNSIATKLPLAGGTLTGNLTINSKLSVSKSSTDFIAEFQNTNGTNPYGLRIKDASSPANNYPLFSVSNSGGTVEYFRVNSGTGAATFSGNVSLADTKYIQLNNTSTDWQLRADNAGRFVVQTTNGSEQFKVGGSSLIEVGSGTGNNTFLVTKSSAGWYSGIKLTRGLGDGSSTGNNNFGMLVTDNGWEVATFTSPSNNVTGRSAKLVISSGGDVTLKGNGTTSALLFGQSSYARIINTSGQILYIDSDTHEFRTNGGVRKLLISSTGETTIIATSTSGLILGQTGQSYYHNIRNQGDGLYIGVDDGGQGGAGADLRINIKGSEKMRITSGGDVDVKTGKLFVSNGNIIGGSASDITGTHYFNKGASVNGGILYAGSSTTGRFSLVVQASDMGYNNTPATCLKIGGTNSTSRSISAAGTVNVSGNDYAEYMTKAITDDISKGDVVGINSDCLLTNIFSDAISFVIKSTDPSFVGGDIWGIESEDEDDIEEARIKVDRVAFSGQVPCNVTGASVGDYIIPVASSDGKITGEAVTNPTFEQYKISVGKVWKIMENGNSWVAVKIG